MYLIKGMLIKSGSGGGWGDLAANLPQAVNAASVLPKPKISHEVHPFTRESLEKINLRTSNLIRDYGFLPRRAPSILDGAQLPAKYEPFPVELLGKPVEEVDQYVYDKVRQITYIQIPNFMLMNLNYTHKHRINILSQLYPRKTCANASTIE